MIDPVATVIVLAKAPIPGRAKTRLCPPCTPEEAARLAEAALVDTLAAVMRTHAVRPLLVLEGPPGDWVPDGLEVVAQQGDGLDERIVAAFAAADGPALLVGMDTPQITDVIIRDAVGLLMAHGTDAVLGECEDGGFWALGHRAFRAELTLGVPMSTDRTGAIQRQRLVGHGQRVGTLPILRDVDTMDDALAVAEQAPTTRFGATLAALGHSAHALTAT